MLPWLGSAIEDGLGEGDADKHKNDEDRESGHGANEAPSHPAGQASDQRNTDDDVRSQNASQTEE